ncbi:MAG: hypothetical protein Q8J68_12075, partial [Methanolobus sp.]|uniref:hypothetical protein n=1 Tax=Methanolobus sp. TaxID=1874737 RepID=UPI002731E9A4
MTLSIKTARVLYLLLCSAFILIAALCLSLNNSSINGYEPHIYKSYSLELFILFLLLLYSLLIISYFVLFNVNETKLLVYHTVLLGLVYWIVLTFPQLIKYAFYGRGDIPTHLGYTIDILESGSTISIYPFDKILVSIISLFTGISERIIIQYI